MTETPPSVPAGWYPAPEGDDRQRYWDGTAWTEHYAPSRQQTAASASPPPRESMLLNRRRRTNKIILITFGVIALLILIPVLIGSLFRGGNGDSSPKADPTSATPTPSTAPSSAPTADPATPSAPPFKAKSYAKTIEKYYVNQLGRPIKDGCDAAFTMWQCYYDGVASPFASRLDIKLSMPGDISEADARHISEQARLGWFNFVGHKFEKLDDIVTFVDGVDSGTTYRRDVPLLNR